MEDGDGGQELMRVRRDDEGFETEVLGRVAFVPFLTGAVETQAERPHNAAAAGLAV